MCSIVLDLHLYPAAGGETSVPMFTLHVRWGRCAAHLERLTVAKELQRTWHPLMFYHIVCTRQETSCFWQQVPHQTRQSIHPQLGAGEKCSQKQKGGMPLCLLAEMIICIHISDYVSVKRR